MSRDSFTERMALGKVIAADLRNHGRQVGKAKGYAKPEPLKGLDAIEHYYNQFRKDIHYNAYTAVETALFGFDVDGLVEF